MTPDELTFVRRMAPHVAAGLTIEAAARAVLADDQRLLSALMEDRPARATGAQGDGGPMTTWAPTDKAAGLRTALAHHVYNRLRAAP